MHIPPALPLLAIVAELCYPFLVHAMVSRPAVTLTLLAPCRVRLTSRLHLPSHSSSPEPCGALICPILSFPPPIPTGQTILLQLFKVVISQPLSFIPCEAS